MNAVILANPRAGRQGADGGLESSLTLLRDAGWSVSIEQSQGRGDATRIARNAVEAGLDAVLVAGGDGTLNEAIQALANTDTALGYLPYGTVNIWARELKIPLDPRQATQSILDGRTVSVDLGIANGRYFLLMAGLGFDGEVVRRARSLERHKARFGVLPYVAAGLTTVPRYWGSDIELRYDGVIRKVQALMLVIGNTRLYGGLFHITPDAVANDGWLDLCIIKGKGPMAMVRQSLPMLLSRSISHADVETVRVRSLSVQTSPPAAFQLDGELVGTTPVNFGIAPGALRAIVPHDLVTDLIA